MKTYLLGLSALACSLFAKPTGVQVVHGQCSETAPNRFETGHQTILSWEGFSIGKEEHLHFEQARQSSIVLNRVRGHEASHLLGQLSSNGAVWLINPQGVLIGSECRIETGGFLASTLDVLDVDFLEQRAFLFSGDSPHGVVNLGTVECASGNVVLLGCHIENHGILHARAGNVLLGEGLSILLEPENAPHIHILAQTELKLSDSVYEKAIYTDGRIEASRLEERGGHIYLVADEEIFAASTSKTIASEGGNISFDGRNVGVEKGAELRADAGETGSGGNILVWGDESVVFQGTVSARGGMLSGDGGFVEISSPNLYFHDVPPVNLSAPHGKTGELLLDPTNITIQTPTASTAAFTACPNSIYPINVGVSPNLILVSDLETQLNTCSVRIATSSTGTDAGNITVSNAVTGWNSANSLTLVADGAIAINAAITNASTGGLILTTLGNATGNFTGITVSQPITITNGPITLSGIGSGGNNSRGVEVAANISSGGGAITFQNCRGGGTGSGDVGVRVSGTAAVDAGSGSVIFNNILGGGTTTGNYGVQVGVASAALVQGTTITASDIFGGPGTSSNNGFYINGGQLGGSTTTTISIQAGSLGTTTTNAGIVIDSGGKIGDATTAPNITSITLDGTGSLVGTSTSTNYGIQINSTATSLLTTTAGTISLTGLGGGLGAGATSYGIFCNAAGTISGGAGITFVGRGGGGTGVDNMGVRIEAGTVSLSGSSGTILFRDCVGGPVGLSGNRGIYIIGASTVVNAGDTGTVRFRNCAGGGTTSANVGVQIGAANAATIQGQTIVASDIFGGPGTTLNYGFYVNGSQLGSTATTNVSIQAGALGTTTSNIGIVIDSTGKIGDATTAPNITSITLDGTGSLAGTDTNYGIQFNSSATNPLLTTTAGTISLTGRGGGLRTGTGANNDGIRCDGTGTISGGTGITLVGIGGGGTGATNIGVRIQGNAVISLSGNSGTILFRDCVGGAAGSSGTRGIYIAGALTSINAGATGTVRFRNIQGGGTTSDNYGLQIGDLSASTILGQTIIASDCMGGPGSTGLNYGIWLRGGIIGDSNTNSVSLQGGSLGTGGDSNRGILLTNSAAITATQGATPSITFVGSGSPNGVTNNWGIQIDLSGATLTTSSTGTISLTGIGGGSGIGAANYGIFCSSTGTISGGTGITFVGRGGGGTGTDNTGILIQTGTPNISLSGSNGTILFRDCVGGPDGSSSNRGVYLNSTTAVIDAGSTGTVRFQNVSGGTGTSSSNRGVEITGTVRGSSIIATDVNGGRGTSSDIGFFVTSGTIGARIADGDPYDTASIQITAGSSSTGVNGDNVGIWILNASSRIKTGSTGTIILKGTAGGHASSGPGNRGIYLHTGQIIGGTAVTLTGVGGSGGTSANDQEGVRIDGGGILLTGSNPVMTFKDCVGGARGNGVTITAPIDTGSSSGQILFTNCVGGSLSANNYGVDISGSNALLKAGTITAEGILGGKGSGGFNFGFRIEASAIVGCLISAGDPYDTTLIKIQAGSLGGGGSNHGIATGSTAPTIRVGANGQLILDGQGSLNGGAGASNHGISLETGTIVVGGNITPGTTRITGRGGAGTGSSFGVNFTAAATMNAGSVLNFENCIGGSGGNSNYGLNLGTLTITSSLTATNIVGGSGGTDQRGMNTGSLTATALTATNIHGGSGSATNYGINTGTLNISDSVTFTDVFGGGNSTGDNNHGWNSGTINTPTITATNIWGGNGINTNFGIVAGTWTGSTSITCTDIFGGGNGTGNDNFGFAVGTITAPTIRFDNIVGGQGVDRNHGVRMLASTLGNSSTTSLYIKATGGGTGSDNGGFRLDGVFQAGFPANSLIVGDGTATFICTAGGTGSGQNNRGIYLNPSIQVLNIFFGVTTGCTLSITGVGGIGTSGTNPGFDSLGTWNIQGANSSVTFLDCKGGSGGTLNYGVEAPTMIFGNDINSTSQLSFTNCSGGSGNSGVHRGASIARTLTFNGTATLNFTNCSGGSGGNNNRGVSIDTAITATTAAGCSATFSNCRGGSGGTGNHGVVIASSVPGTITAKDIFGGAGTTTNYGFYVTGGTLGNTSATSISIANAWGGSSATTTTDNPGIYLQGGTLQVDSGTSSTASIALEGFGGGEGDGTDNYGVRIAAVTMNAGNAITISGSGGSGTNATGNHRGVYISTNPTITFSNETSSTLAFVDCIGGTGGTGNTGLLISGNLSPTIPGGSTLATTFTNCIGGAGTTGHLGLSLTAGTVGGTTIQGWDIAGGIGTTDNYGLSLSGGIMGDTSTSSIEFIASGGRGASATSSNRGISITGGTLRTNSGTVSLQGTGGGGGAGSGNSGIRIAGGTWTTVGTMTLSGVGGAGSGGTNYGVYISTAPTISGGIGTLAFGVNGAGSATSTSVAIDPNFNLGSGNLQFAAPTTLAAPGILTCNALTADEALSLAVDAEFVVTTAALSGAVEGPGTFDVLGAGSVSLNSIGQAVPCDDIILAGNSVILAGNLTAAGDILCLSPIVATNDLTLYSGLNITTNAINATGFAFNATAEGNISVGAITALSIALQPNSGLTAGDFGNLPNGTLTLKDALVATDAIALSPAGRTSFPSVATITSSLMGNDITISGTSLVMGQNEVMTALGAISISLDRIASLGDIVALNDIAISAQNIVLPQRGSVQILDAAGALYASANPHFVSRIGSVLISTGTINTTGREQEVSGLTSGDLVATVPASNAEYILNFDEGSPTPPTPPAPPIPPSVLQQLASVAIVLRADTELGNRLPIFWPPTHFQFIGKFCPEELFPTPCGLSPIQFEAEIFQNDVR